ncbi:FecR domain-containing protein [Chitinimonas sp.]|uniref:FecR domain-containing protein n=1 Tax=Chitinimonas sp. TaxID=1934313 RepID=UPI0035B1511F
MRASWSAVLLAALLSSLVQAAATTVAAVNMPAWLERDGQMRPLAPGATLQSSDIIHTGAGARVLLTLPEGSQVKLGEDALFRLDSLNGSDGRKTPFTAALNVLKGAFRFTTGLISKPRQREIDVHIATVTAGIRGTDLWGKADNEKDLVCLLEGNISVQRDGEAGFTTLDQPYDFYVAPKGKPSLPVAKVDPAKVRDDWAPQTETRPGAGLAKAGGRWSLTLAKVDKQEDALAWYDKLRNAGFDARIRPVANGKLAIKLDGLASRDDATALGARLKAEFDVPDAVVGR